MSESIRATHKFTLFSSAKTKGDVDGNYVIAKYQPETGGQIVAVGENLPEMKDVMVEFTGEWEKGKYGKQFKVNYFDVIPPSSRTGIVSYLSSLKCGIGNGLANKMYIAYGENLWSVINGDPDRLTNVKGISENKVLKLKEALGETKETREIMMACANCESIIISPNRAKEIIKTLGHQAVDIINSSTYKLCEVQGFSFTAVDALAKLKGMSQTDPLRVEYAVKYLLDKAAVSGHMCFPLPDLAENLRIILNGGVTNNPVSLSFCQSSLNNCIGTGIIKRCGRFAYTPLRFEQERDTAENLVRIQTAENCENADVSSFIDEYESKTGFSFAPCQKQAVKNCFQHPVTIVTGGPGTGKSTIIKAIIAAYDHVNGKSMPVLLIAPTGRAARRMAEATGKPASTIHSAIGYTGHGECLVDEIEEKLVIIDEVSMLDQYIADLLLERIVSGTRVVFVGDADQLPSVGEGNVLYEMIRSSMIPTTKLDVIFRQGKDSPIITNANKIRNGETDICWQKGFSFCEVSNENLFEQAISIYIQAVKRFGIDNAILLNPYREKSSVSVNLFNKELQKRLNPIVPNTLTILVNGTEFRDGDKVMQIKNTDIAKNGDIGYVKEIVREIDESDPMAFETVAYIEWNDDGVKHRYSNEMLANVTLAYCMTIHKAQGAEYQTVVMTASSLHSVALRRNLIYTGVTRAIENVVVVGEKEVFNAAVRNDSTDKRYTLLGDRLHSFNKNSIERSL